MVGGAGGVDEDECGMNEADRAALAGLIDSPAIAPDRTTDEVIRKKKEGGDCESMLEECREREMRLDQLVKEMGDLVDDV